MLGKQNWSVSDTTFLLETLKELKIIERLDGRKCRNTDLFRQVHEKLDEAGIQRTIEQIKNRWKSLKASYYKAKNKNGKSGSDPASFSFYVLMDELMGDRPLSNTTDSGVDIGLEDEMTNAEEYCPEANQEDGSLTDDESSFEEAAGSTTEKIPNVTEEICPSTFQETWTPRKRPRGNSGYAKAMHTWTTDQQAFHQKMQESQNKWIKEQQERRQQREERLLLRFLEESTRSTERIVRQCFDGLKSVMTQMTPPPQGMPPVLPYPPQHQYPVQSGSAQFPQNNPSYNADYYLHDLS